MQKRVKALRNIKIFNKIEVEVDILIKPCILEKSICKDALNLLKKKFHYNTQIVKPLFKHLIYYVLALTLFQLLIYYFSSLSLSNFDG